MQTKLLEGGASLKRAKEPALVRLIFVMIHMATS